MDDIVRESAARAVHPHGAALRLVANDGLMFAVLGQWSLKHW